MLAALADPSLESRLRVARARIELGHPETGNDLGALAQQQPGDWRVDWLRGLRSLVEDDLEPARQALTAVLDALPGEAAPKLALALCETQAGSVETAARGYAARRLVEIALNCGGRDNITVAVLPFVAPARTIEPTKRGSRGARG